MTKKYIVQSKSRTNLNIGVSVKKLIKQHVCKGNCIRSPSIKACQWEYFNNYTKHTRDTLMITWEDEPIKSNSISFKNSHFYCCYC